MKNTNDVGEFPSNPASHSQSNIPGPSPGGGGSGCTRGRPWPRDCGMLAEAIVLLKTGSEDHLWA